VTWSGLKIDGGMVSNDWLAQDLADLLDQPVERPEIVETTPLGAAMLAAVGARIHPDLATAAQAMRGSMNSFAPVMSSDMRTARLEGWAEALALV
jgi:glycerol kinase